MGVYQGESLSCILFMLYTNELSLYVPNCVTVVQFADDTQLLISGKKSDLPRIIRIMEETQGTIYIWFCVNSLKVNTAKTQR